MKPHVATVRQDNTHRLIAARYDDDSVLHRIADDASALEALIELDSGTNERLAGEANLLPGISVHELLFGVEHAPVVNAAFTHSHPEGSRFSDGSYGAYYAGHTLHTAIAETRYHRARFLAMTR
jgi:hypothetical protein